MLKSDNLRRLSEKRRWPNEGKKIPAKKNERLQKQEKNQKAVVSKNQRRVFKAMVSDAAEKPNRMIYEKVNRFANLESKLSESCFQNGVRREASFKLD